MADKKIHVGGQGLPLRQRLFTRRNNIILLVAVLILGAGLGAYTYWTGTQTSHKKVDSAIKSSDNATLTGNFEDSYNALKEASETAQSKEDKIRIYNNLSLAAANSNKLKEAINYLQEKHKLDPSSIKPDAGLMGGYYERMDDKAHAIEQYKIALEYAKINKEQSQYNIASVYEAKLKNLEE